MTQFRTTSLLFIAFFCFAISLSAHDLVEVRLINPRIQVDMRYATDNNALGRAIYPFPGCFLVREVAEKLSKVQRELEKEGYGLIIFDAYRPRSMQSFLQVEDESHDSNTIMKCVVEDESGHNRGTAVDVALICLSGYLPEMPSEFGDPTERARRNCLTHSAHIYHNSHKLEQAMKRQGFCPSPQEWWHFDYCGWCGYPILDVQFEDLVQFQPRCRW